MKKFTILSALVFALLVPVLTGSAAPAQITFISVSGNWHDPVDNVPGRQQGDPVIRNGVPTSSISWGETSGSQSGYDFSRKIPGAQTLPPAPTPFFPLGTFTHRNFTVSDPSLTSVQLDVVLTLNVDGVQTGPLKFTFTFNHVETPNNQTPCPYPTPSGEGCTDRVTFVSAPRPTTFKVGGVDYTLSMSFVDNGGNPVAEFITREGRVNTADLVGQFTLPPASVTTPVLTVTKSGPAAMTVGQWGNFALDVRNTGTGDAWNASIRDVLPDGSTGGMCDQRPEILSAQVFAADGVTPAAGKGPLNSGSDYLQSYSAAPNCRLDIAMLTAASRIGPSERLIIRYRTQLDANTQGGVALTNVAGAIQWFDADSSNSNRRSSTRTLTNGTPGFLDHEDAFTVTVPGAVSASVFEKTVADLTTGANPATTARPGDRLRYTLRFRAANQPLSNFRITDELDALNAQAYFAPGTLTLIMAPTGADTSGTSNTGGGQGTGLIDIRNLNVPAGGEVLIQFDTTLKPGLANGTVVANQSTLRLGDGTTFASSDDPNVSGTADPTRVTIAATAATAPAFRVQKTSADMTGDPNVLLPGERLRYTITVKNVGTADAVNAMLRDAMPANTTYVAGSTTMNGTPLADVAGGSPLANGMRINSPANANPGLMPPDASPNPANVATITFDVVVNPNVANGTVISNQGFVSATATVDQPSDDPRTPAANDPTINIVTNPGAVPGSVFEKSVANLTSGANPATTAAPGDKLRYTLRFRTTNQALSNFRIVDELDALNAQAYFAAGTLTVVGSPAGADITGTSNTGGAKGTGLIDVRNLNLPAGGGEVIVQFDINLKPGIANGTVVSNQSALRLADGTIFAMSDNPNVAGASDPTRVTIVAPATSAPSFRVQKISTDLSGDPNVLLAGETLRYTITVKNVGNADAANVTLRDAAPANTSYVAGSTTLNGGPIADVAGVSPLVMGMRINSPANTTPGAMPADAPGSPANPANVATITFDVFVNPNAVNDTVISNQGFVSAAGGIADVPSDDPRTPVPNDPTIDIVGNLAGPMLVVTKLGPLTLNRGQWGNFALDVRNTGATDAWDTTLRDRLPVGTTGGMCNLTPEILSAQVFAADGFTPAPGKGPLGVGSGLSVSYSAAPNCELELTLSTAAGKIGPDERLIIRYRTQLDANSQNGVMLTNIAAAIQWFNADSSKPNRKSTTRTLTNGTPAIPDHEDAHTVTVALSGYVFEKTVANLTSGLNPATTAVPGDKLRYTLRFRTTEALTDFRIVDEMDALNAQPYFVPGTLALVSSPTGADISGTSGTGGSNGTGIIDIRNLNLPATGGEVLIQFDITLKSPIANGTIVTNQATLRQANGTTFTYSDDPNVNGAADPNASGDEDPTRVRIVAPPAGSPPFRVQKISTDMTGDPNVLLAGETLRYTITVKNTSNADAVNVTLRDAVPANTTYVAGSTTLNGAAVADAAGTSPLVSGMPINSPGNTPGSMPADVPANTGNPANLATITFDVVVNQNVAGGTAISNQGFVSAGGSGIVDQPSDDPRTPAPNDPTVNIVGSVPALYAEKRVVLFDDLGSPDIVDPGDVLRYTITVKNSAAIPVTSAVLTDAVPANTTYVANSTLLNGSPVGQPDNGVSPLASGITINSTGQIAGTIAPGATAVLQFDLRVNLGTPAGTLISNQAVVTASGRPNVLTDGDGNPANGAQPTVVVVGVGQQVSISSKVSVVGGGPAVPGAELEYVVTIVNTATVPALKVVITDDLNVPQPAQLAYVDQSATLDGSQAGVSFAGSTITANYSAVNGPLAPRGVSVLKFRATLNSKLALGTLVTNTAVVTWNNPTQSASSSVSISLVVGSAPGLSVISGAAWHDANFNETPDSGERVLEGWKVELYRDNQLWKSVETDATGAYRFIGVDPNFPNGVRYELRFRAPGAGANTAMLGRTVSPFTNGLQRITDIVVRPATDLKGLNLPIHPNGVVYNSGTRAAIAGATLALLDARSNSPLPASCFDDQAQQGQITLPDGYYKFDINFSSTACPGGGDYLIAVTPPAGSNYVPGYSQIIPPASNASTAAFSVPACLSSVADAVPGTAAICEVQPSEFAPVASVPPRSAGTTYHIHLMLDGSEMPGTSQVFNNHIPLDTELPGPLTITKSSPMVNVSRGQLIPYVITVNNRGGTMYSDVSIVDRLPAGFGYVKGSALLDGLPIEPAISGLTLSWNGLIIAGTQERTLRLLVAVGAGVTEGEYVNRAQVMYAGMTVSTLSTRKAQAAMSPDATGTVSFATSTALSTEATATVRLLPDPTFDCTDVTGKVFNDANGNGLQEDGEEGLPGVRVVTATGLNVTTDRYGRYHMTCAITPNESRGSNFVLKLDDRTLPSGFRMTTDRLRIERATRGKTLRVNFGASVQKVVGIDLSDAAFEPGSTEIRSQWKSRVDLLLEELRKAPAMLRLSYVADTEDEALVKRRVEAFKRQLTGAWDAADHSYGLTIEDELFWRRGAPSRKR
jgi:large repetitive protein